MTRIAVIRADASYKIGGGHIYRCLTLANALADAGWHCVFACRAGTVETVSALARSRHSILDLDAADESARLREGYPDGIDLLVVDHYGLDARFETACRTWARQIMVLDDVPGRRHDCDILLNQNLGADEESYGGHVPEHCRFLLGPRHALLRPQFAMGRRAALTRRAGPLAARRLLVSLGASDPLNITPSIVSAAAGLQLELDVVLGASSNQGGAILEIASQLGVDVRIHIDVSDMAALMISADMAVGAGGATSWERCCLGLPALLVVTADNQRVVARHLADAGIAEILGWAPQLEPLTVVTALRRLAESPEQLAAMSRAAFSTCDGLGAGRVLAQVAPEHSDTGDAVTLRPANAEDCELVWNWQNEPHIRRHFRNPQPPGWEEHQLWFERHLNDPRAEMCIIELAGTACGLLRLDPLDEDCRFEVSILVSTQYQGQGIGTAGLKLAPLLLPWADLLADVKSDNTQSRGAFLAAGFVDDGAGHLVRSSSLGKGK